MFFNSAEERIKDFNDLWRDFAPEESDSIVIKNSELMDYLINNGFFTAPASTKYHGAYEGGLYDHCRCVFDRLNILTHNDNLQWSRDESPFIVGFFHDLCKCDQYIPIIETEYTSVEGNKHTLFAKDKITGYEYNTKTLLKGHGSKSVMILSQFINLTEEEMLCVRYHMGAYEKEEWTEFDMAIRKYPNVLWTHMADMLASKVDDV